MTQISNHSIQFALALAATTPACKLSSPVADAPPIVAVLAMKAAGAYALVIAAAVPSAAITEAAAARRRSQRAEDRLSDIEGRLLAAGI